MAQFTDDKKQAERLEDLHRKEEEQLAEMLATKYGIEYIDLTNKSIDTDALRLITAGRRAVDSDIATWEQLSRTTDFADGQQIAAS